jgi:para-aminobenzoate synthetase / 4-amino-4-deoxychorismate lyase
VPQWTQLPASIYTLVADHPNSVLLQTSRFDAENQTSYLYLDPVEVLTAPTLEDLPALFSRIESALASGHHAAGYLAYECGYHFEHFPHIPNPSSSNPPLAWFGIYTQPITFNHATNTFTPPLELPNTPPEATEPFTQNLTLNITEPDYTQKILHIKDLIAAGDTYQVNFTTTATLETPLPPAAAFNTLSRRQPVSYAALINLGKTQILSLSPELFFRIDKDRILTRPMKGTMPRGLDLAEDTLAALRLQNDEKNRSEHVMIVDLLRNDLGRICTLGSVRVEDLFTVERYLTLHQMTSTISGHLRPNLPFYEIFRALFPSGSITGAPKIRTMEIIHDTESTPRGIYTGAIGHIAPNRNATFNVAIRTLVLENNQATMGVGGGIITDSDPASEYRECLLKASFLTRPPQDFQLIETILWNPTNTAPFYLLDLHLDRLAASAAYFNIPCDPTAITTQLNHHASTLPLTPHRIRLLVDQSGAPTITSIPFAPKPTGLIRIATEPTNSQDLYLRHKTTRRSLYDREYGNATAEGFDEVLFLNDRNELTEGAISNLFIRHNGRLLTPPLASGVLPGIYRRHILETDPTAEESVLTLEDLRTADAIYICNSVRGMNQVRLVKQATPKVTN